MGNCCDGEGPHAYEEPIVAQAPPASAVYAERPEGHAPQNHTLVENLAPPPSAVDPAYNAPPNQYK